MAPSLHRIAVGSVLAVLVLLPAGCVRPPPAVQSDILDELPAVVQLPEKEVLLKSPYLLELAHPLEEVWRGILHSMAPAFWILRVDEGDRRVLFLEIDGFGGHILAEFPMALLVEEERSDWTLLYVLPLKAESLGFGGKTLRSYRRRQTTRAKEFMHRMHAELEPSERWPWLFESGGP